MLTLYELAGAEEDRRFSPYCWRARLALRRKELPFDAVACRFTEKERLAFSGQEKVPVLVDGERTIPDSWAIALHLEEAYPDRPSLFGGPGGLALARFVADWSEIVLHTSLIRLLALPIHDHLHEGDKAYFRRTREARFKATLEDFCAEPEARLAEFRRALSPLRATLRAQPYLGGEGPLYADHCVMGAFLWARAVSPLELLEADDPVAAWRDRMLAGLDPACRSLRAYA